MPVTNEAAEDRYLGSVIYEASFYLVALAASFAIATLLPARCPGAVLLLYFQVEVLGTPNPAVTPTHLLYNVVATSGALFR